MLHNQVDAPLDATDFGNLGKVLRRMKEEVPSMAAVEHRQNMARALAMPWADQCSCAREAQLLGHIATLAEYSIPRI